MSEKHEPVMEHASRPGLWSCLILVLVGIGYAMIVNGAAVKKFFATIF